ncbi:polysaccharide pyruvyl transferase family protein [Arthrobacter sp. EH-1B-1]|uniref:Polysaccharide pyruvyl transferase family protein n=1 Tax=Arthrobacter vasquezii TaxID=2977629 RepID=A0ABT6CTH5_9MICC|nr:polysaccharide pyruvyl transferase family protein [Arthrobacter vasquezii]MDF9277367.1 polysaccharide pyruvyl transferase family protein [Arthrobacter vasquezii]
MQPELLYLVSPAGNPNFGDEFIAASWLKYLSATRPEADVWLDCPQPGLAQVLFDGMHPRLRITNTLWRLTHDNANLPPDESRATVRARVIGLGSPAYDLGLLKLREATSLHLLGGGYINGNWEHHAALIHSMRAVQEITSAPLFATGQGLMPAIASERGAQTLFEGFAHVSARDDASARAYGIDLGLDDAFLGAAETRSGALPGLYVCIQNDTVDAGAFDQAVQFARTRAIEARQEGTAVFYVEAIPGGDRVGFEKLSDIIPEDHFIPFSRIWSEGLPVASDQVWLTSRFHFHLLASAAGARGVAFAMKEGYYDVKHQSLVSLGSGWTVAGPGQEPAFPAPSGALVDKLPALAASKRTEAAKMYLAGVDATATSSSFRGDTSSKATFATRLRSRLAR